MPERPLECSECKRPIAVHYREVAEGKITETGMCNACPVLQRQLHGTRPEEKSTTPGEPAGISCQCGTTLEEIRTGSPVGCHECYDVFDEMLMHDLVVAKKISRRLGIAPAKGVPLHVGCEPGQAVEISPKIKLVALDQALEATLKGEDYEGAAWLRDQIKAAKEELDE